MNYFFFFWNEFFQSKLSVSFLIERNYVNSALI